MDQGRPVNRLLQERENGSSNWSITVGSGEVEACIIDILT